ncbi:MAG: hypothetical protein S4CHLAM7_10940 [Chlamydiae bacterium]|nr:hypothetical protein [Chlamydiota bacterium]
MKNVFLILSLVSSFVFSSSKEERKAVVIKPVADLLGQPHVHSPKKGISLEEYYHKIPFSGTSNACWRLHQVLFNEVVTVLDEKGSEVKVKISNFYYLLDNESSPKDTYWTSKENLLFLDKVVHKKIDISHFPPPISYKEKKPSSDREQNVVTLKKPFFDPSTKTTYSVGTRFLAHADQDFRGSFDKGSFDVYIFDPKTQELLDTQIPKRYCIRNYLNHPDDQIKNFVSVLRSWAYQKKGFIPYVLGGFSWTLNCNEDAYEAKIDPENNHPYFHRNTWTESSKIGFDCVGIIGRAAQVCNIPFFYKNTRTLLKGLKCLKKGEKIREGDLLWFPGHVMVVSNLKKNLIVEARGYDHGSGRVREVHINKIFEEVNSFDELLSFYHKKRHLSLLDKEGKVFTTCKKYEILKINSVWNHP